MIPFVTLLLTLLATLASAQNIACGAVLTGGTYTLSEDFICPNPPTAGPALTLRDGATLDCAGYTLDIGPWILMDGTASVLTDCGIIAADRPLWITGPGPHRVTRLTVHTAGIGTLIQATATLIEDSQVFDATEGFLVQSDGNVLRRNEVWADTGYVVSGTGNRLISNTSPAHFTGFIVRGDDNWLLGNDATGWGDVGFWVFGVGNTLGLNRASQNNYDALDNPGDCSLNRWLGNEFVNAPPCTQATIRSVRR